MNSPNASSRIGCTALSPSELLADVSHGDSTATPTTQMTAKSHKCLRCGLLSDTDRCSDAVCGATCVRMSKPHLNPGRPSRNFVGLVSMMVALGGMSPITPPPKIIEDDETVG